MIGFNQRADLRDDVIGSSIWKDKILVACFIVPNKPGRGARQHFETDDSAVHGIHLNEVEHPWIPARVHGLGQDQSIEFAVVLWLSNDDPRFVCLTAHRCTRDEVFLRLVPILRVDVLCRHLYIPGIVMRVHECFEKRAGSGHFYSRRDGSNDLFHGLGCGLHVPLPASALAAPSTLTLAALTLSAAALTLAFILLRVLAGYRNRRLSQERNRADRQNNDRDQHHGSSEWSRPLHCLPFPRIRLKVIFWASVSCRPLRRTYLSSMVRLSSRTAYRNPWWVSLPSPVAASSPC